MDPAEPLPGIGHELVNGIPIPNVAAPGEDLHTHGRQGRFREQRLLGDVPAGEVDEAERHMTAQPAKLQGYMPAQPGGASCHDDDLAAPPFANRLRARVFERSPAGLRRLVFPGGAVAEAEGWQWHGVR